jgi:hypothetical protein
MDEALDRTKCACVDLRSVAEPDASIVILQKLYLHPEKINVMDSLKIESNLVADLQTVHLWVRGHQLLFISSITKLPVIELNLAIISMLHLLRSWPYNGVEITVISSLGVIVCWLLSTLLRKNLEARRIEHESELLAQPT